MKKLAVVLLMLAVAVMLLIGIKIVSNGSQQKNNEADMKTLTITSPAFKLNEKIPEKYTCDGANISPLLEIAGIPKNTKSIAIIVDDPDSPSGNFVHWIAWNIPVKEKIEENTSLGIQGANDFGKNGYGGPCPGSGTHRYVFKIYALDVELALEQGSQKKELEKSMQNHIIAKGELIGRYQRK